MKRFGVLFLFAIMAVVVSGQDDRRQNRVPAVPHPVEWVQPSGDTIMIRIIGDENWSCRTTEEGYVLVENRKGAMCYARVDCKGRYKATCIVASSPERRTKKELRYIEKMKKNEKLWRQMP